MSDGLNRVYLIGNLGADPELRFTQDGTAVLSLRLACNESYLDRDKVSRERVEWVAVVVWGKRGEGLAKILKKGETIAIEGGLRTSSYEKDGAKVYKTEVHATNVVLMGGNRGGAPEPGDTGGGYTRRPGDAPRGGPAPARGQGGRGGPGGGDGSDIPF